MSIETDQILTSRKIFNVAHRNLYDHMTDHQYTWSMLYKCNSKELPVIERGFSGLRECFPSAMSGAWATRFAAIGENFRLLFTNRVRICYTMGIENANRWVEDRQK